MYAGIFPIKNAGEKEFNYIIIKFGYADNIIKRIDTIQDEIGSDIILIGLRLVKSKIQ